jgi:uncharacterized protein YceK
MRFILILFLILLVEGCVTTRSKNEVKNQNSDYSTKQAQSTVSATEPSVPGMSAPQEAVSEAQTTGPAEIMGPEQNQAEQKQKVQLWIQPSDAQSYLVFSLIKALKNNQIEISKIVTEGISYLWSTLYCLDQSQSRFEFDAYRLKPEYFWFKTNASTIEKVSRLFDNKQSKLKELLSEIYQTKTAAELSCKVERVNQSYILALQPLQEVVYQEVSNKHTANQNETFSSVFLSRLQAASMVQEEIWYVRLKPSRSEKKSAQRIKTNQEQYKKFRLLELDFKDITENDFDKKNEIIYQAEKQIQLFINQILSQKTGENSSHP